MRSSLIALAFGAACAQAATITSLNKASILRSGRLAVTGTGFGSYTQGCRVTIGGVDAWLTTWSPGRIVAYVPETAPLGSKAVQVHTPGGSSNVVSIPIGPRKATAGRLAWRFETDDIYIMTRIVTGPEGTVFAKGIDGHTYALTPDGGLKWVFNDGLTDPGDMSLMEDGTVVVGGANNVIAIWPDGTLRWRVGNLGTKFAGGPTVGPDGHVYGITNEFYGGVGAFEISPEGLLLRTMPLLPNRQGQTYPYTIAFSGADWYGCLPPHVTQGGAGVLFSLRLGGGVNWSRSGQGQSLRLPNGNIYAQRVDNDNNYGVYDANGNAQWTHHFNSLGVPGFFPSAGPDGSVYQVTGGSRLVKFGPSGAIAFNRGFGYWTLQYPAVRHDDQLIVANGSYNLTDPREVFGARQDGTVAWRYVLPQEDGVFIHPGSVMAFSPDGKVVYQGFAGNNYAADAHSYVYALRTGPLGAKAIEN